VWVRHPTPASVVSPPAFVRRRGGSVGCPLRLGLFRGDDQRRVGDGVRQPVSREGQRLVFAGCFVVAVGEREALLLPQELRSCEPSSSTSRSRSLGMYGYSVAATRARAHHDNDRRRVSLSAARKVAYGSRPAVTTTIITTATTVPAKPADLMTHIAKA